MLQLFWGNYAFPAGTMEVVPDMEVVFDSFGRAAAEYHRFDCEGEIFALGAAGQAGSANAEALMRLALSQQGMNFGLRRDDGGWAYYVANAATIYGTRVTRVRMPKNDGFEFVSGRTVSFTVEFVRSLRGFPCVLKFSERFSTTGGGPVYDFMPIVNDVQEPTQIYAQAAGRAVQQGSCTALGDWAEPPAPVLGWGALTEEPDVSYDSPQVGPRGPEFMTSWSYKFGSPFRLNGRPTLFVGSGGG
jgi:hypothetical protein